jgi:hypothetical protein
MEGSSEVVKVFQMIVNVVLGIGAIALLIVYGPKIAKWLKSMLAKANQPEEPAKDVATEINQALDRMIDERDNVRDIIIATKAQTELLVRLAVDLAKHQTDNLRDIKALDSAIEAIQSGDPLRLAIASGSMPDPDIKVAMATNPEHVESSYWVSTLSMIGKQKGELDLWAGRYERMSQSLFDEVSLVKSKLLLIEARQDILEVGMTYREIVGGIDTVLGTFNPSDGTKVRFLPAFNKVQ